MPTEQEYDLEADLIDHIEQIERHRIFLKKISKDLDAEKRSLKKFRREILKDL